MDKVMKSMDQEYLCRKWCGKSEDKEPTGIVFQSINKLVMVKLHSQISSTYSNVAGGGWWHTHHLCLAYKEGAYIVAKESSVAGLQAPRVWSRLPQLFQCISMEPGKLDSCAKNILPLALFYFFVMVVISLKHIL